MVPALESVVKVLLVKQYFGVSRDQNMTIQNNYSKFVLGLFSLITLITLINGSKRYYFALGVFILTT